MEAQIPFIFTSILSFCILSRLFYNGAEVVIMKMLTTQISGLFQRIAGNNEEAIEETARLLAQATIGEGEVIFAGFGELDVVGAVALNGVEPFIGAIRYEKELEIGTEDRVWIMTTSADDVRALELAHALSNKFIPFAAIATEKAEDNALFDLASTYISTGLTKGLLPGDNGERIVQPHVLANLFIYEAVKMAYNEMLADD